MIGEEYGNMKSSVFFVWASTCTVAFFFAYFFVPETKGLTLEQIDQMMEETTPRNSAGWKPSVTFSQQRVEKGASVATVEFSHDGKAEP
jgi:hypothetical protein